MDRVELKQTLTRLERESRWLPVRHLLLLAAVITLILVMRHISFLGSLHLGEPREAADRLANSMSLFMATIFGGVAWTYRHDINNLLVETRYAKILASELDVILPQLSPEYLDALCQISHACSARIDGEVQARLEECIANLLLASGGDEVRLSGKSLRWLKKQARCGSNSILRVAALLTLKDRGASELPELARHASASHDDRVQAAGKDILQTLRGVQ